MYPVVFELEINSGTHHERAFRALSACCAFVDIPPVFFIVDTPEVVYPGTYKFQADSDVQSGFSTPVETVAYGGRKI